MFKIGAPLVSQNGSTFYFLERAMLKNNGQDVLGYVCQPNSLEKD